MSSMLKSLLVILVFLQITFTLEGIQELTDDTFAGLVLDSNPDQGKQPVWIVAFTAQWCGHCKILKPQLQSLAAQLKDLDIPQIKLGHVDEKGNNKLINDYVVNHQTHMVSYPTLVAFRHGKSIPVPSHARTSHALLNWAVDTFQLGNPQEDYQEDDQNDDDAGQL